MNADVASNSCHQMLAVGIRFLAFFPCANTSTKVYNFVYLHHHEHTEPINVDLYVQMNSAVTFDNMTDISALHIKNPNVAKKT